MNDYKLNDTVYFLCEYRWLAGKVATNPRPNSKTISITTKHLYPPQCHNSYPFCGTFRVLREKVALPEEEVCIVWELWRGRNGRGGYRLERNAEYPHPLVKASEIGTGDTGMPPNKKGVSEEEERWHPPQNA